MVTTLDRLKPGQTATVLEVTVREAMRRRLAEYGLIPNTGIRCCYRSPDRKLTALQFRDTVLAVRTADLSGISIRV